MKYYYFIIVDTDDFDTEPIWDTRGIAYKSSLYKDLALCKKDAKKVLLSMCKEYDRPFKIKIEVAYE